MNCLNNLLVEGREEARAGVGVRVRETVKEGVGVLLLLLGALSRLFLSSFSPHRGRLWQKLQQMRGLAIA